MLFSRFSSLARMSFWPFFISSMSAACGPQAAASTTTPRSTALNIRVPPWRSLTAAPLIYSGPLHRRRDRRGQATARPRGDSLAGAPGTHRVVQGPGPMADGPRRRDGARDVVLGNGHGRVEVPAEGQPRGHGGREGAARAVEGGGDGDARRHQVAHAGRVREHVEGLAGEMAP